jgi:hypothetical protein
LKKESRTFLLNIWEEGEEGLLEGLLVGDEVEVRFGDRSGVTRAMRDSLKGEGEAFHGTVTVKPVFLTHAREDGP